MTAKLFTRHKLLSRHRQPLPAHAPKFLEQGKWLLFPSFSEVLTFCPGSCQELERAFPSSKESQSYQSPGGAWSSFRIRIVVSGLWRSVPSEKTTALKSRLSGIASLMSTLPSKNSIFPKFHLQISKNFLAQSWQAKESPLSQANIIRSLPGITLRVDLCEVRVSATKNQNLVVYHPSTNQCWPQVESKLWGEQASLLLSTSIRNQDFVATSLNLPPTELFKNRIFICVHLFVLLPIQYHCFDFSEVTQI